MSTSAFGTSGATPQKTSLSGLLGIGTGTAKPTTPSAPYVPPTGGPKLVTNPFGNPGSGIIGSINSATGLGSSNPTPTSIVGNGQVGPLAPKAGLLTGSPSTPLKKTTVTNADGSSTTQEWHPPETAPANSSGNSSTSSATATPTITGLQTASGNGTSSGNAGTTGAAPGMTAPQVGTPAQNAQNLLDQSSLNNNPEYQALAKEQNKIVQGQQGILSAGMGGMNTVGSTLGPGYSNLYAPQGTFALNGEKGILNPELSAAETGNAAEASRLLSGAGLATTGAQGVLSASLPQFNVSPGNVIGQPLQPGGGVDSNYLGGIAAPANIASVQTYTTQNNTIGNSIEKLDNIANGNNGSGGLIANMGTENFNPLNTPIGNQTYSNYYKNLNPAAQAGIQAGLGDIANNVSTVLSSVTGLTPTAVSAIVDSYDFQDLTPQQLNDFLVYVKGYANNAIQANTDSINNIKSGNSVSASNAPLPAPSPNSIGSAALGTGATLAEGLVNKLGASLSGAASDAVAGAVGGAAGGSLFGSFFP